MDRSQRGVHGGVRGRRSQRCELGLLGRPDDADRCGQRAGRERGREGDAGGLRETADKHRSARHARRHGHAAASDRQVGYNEQKAQIASIIAGAFGWRALARQLVGKIPFGAGLIPKAAVAYAGTYAVGQSLERYYGMGYGFSRAERQLAYHEAFERGKAVVRSLLGSVRERRTG